MSNLSLTAVIILLATVEAFCPGEISMERQTTILGMEQGPAGSFFHRVPDEKNNNDKASSVPDDIDSQVAEILRRRGQPPRASTPSTIGGVPIAKATGFGKSSKKKTSAKPFVAIGPQDPLVNNPTKPEMDDQGYTLYTDEVTGVKSRVFEALVDYPCDFTMKIVGVNEGLFVEEIVAVVAEACESEPGQITFKTKALGKWTSVTVQAPVKSSEMLYALYERVDLDPRVKFKF